jgi:beta-galactosidase
MKTLMKIKLSLLISIIAAILCSCSGKPERSEITSFNDNWKFLKPDSILMSEKYVSALNDTLWENITLPHTASIEPTVMKDPQWTGVCWYKKNFRTISENKGKHIAVLFEAAMNDATIWLNGIEIRRHTGGYLPFYLDISDFIKSDSENTILVRLDNRDNPTIPPGKALALIDFNYYSGIYRNAYFIIKNKLHFTDPMELDTIRGGGIIVNTEEISDGVARLNANISVRNQDDKPVRFIVKGILRNQNSRDVASVNSEIYNISAWRSMRVPLSITVIDPKLWSPETPYLYTLETSIVVEGTILEVQNTRFGIREIEITASEGFTINGGKLKIRGTNRHQEYPYIGNALSDNAQYRDAWKIKNAGFNFVRCSHYPQSPAFLDACDELGILVMNAIPGWQFIGDSVFNEHSYQDTREMCRRDRNHPSVIMWENSLNETQMPLDFIQKSNEIVQNELPFKGIYTCSWMDTAYSVFIPARQHSQPPYYWSKYSKNKPIFIVEYGDWEYYAQNAGFNQTEFKSLKPADRSSRQLRASGEIGLLQQAYNYQEAHNNNLYSPAFGDANWLMFDYNRGYAPDIESSGIMDIFRIPKFSFWFYKSQSDDEPVCFIASYNSPNSAEYIRVFSNGDSVTLYRNEILMGTRISDQNVNTTNLAHPPFTFQMPSFEPGTLLARSYKNGKISAENTISTAGKAAKLRLEADLCSRPLKADGADVIFIYASITDEKGNINYDSALPVKFRVEGDASLVGLNPIPAEAGISSILLKAGHTGGKIRVFAESNDLIPASFEIVSENER